MVYDLLEKLTVTQVVNEFTAFKEAGS